jgi:hypothetical protein
MNANIRYGKQRMSWFIKALPLINNSSLANQKLIRLVRVELPSP